MIIAANEEARITKCLASLPSGIELILVDGMSDDKTREIAESFHAKVLVRAFDNFCNQKNFALQACTRPWVLSLDADEELTPSLCQKLTEIVSFPCDYDAFQIKRELYFQGKRLRFGKSSDKPLRLFRNGKGHFVNPIHERLVLKNAKIGFLSQGLKHYSYKSLADYFSKFNKYTSLIAIEHTQKNISPCKVWLNIFFRPFWEFINRFLLRLGFLDGYAGYLYAMISAFYTFIKYAKIIEIYSKDNNA